MAKTNPPQKTDDKKTVSSPIVFSPFDRHKLLVHAKRVRDMLAGRLVDPITVDIEPTNVCNHDCFWCYNRDFRFAHPDSLPQEILLPLIESFQGSGIKGVIFSGGGEPLVHPDIDSALIKTAEANLDCCLYTNGSLINSHFDAIIRSCRSLNISLDAGTTATHTFMHRPSLSVSGSGLEQILDNLRAVKNLAPHIFVNVSFVVHSRNYREIHKLAQMLSEIGIDLLHVKSMVTYKSHLDESKLAEFDEQIKLAQEQIKIVVTGPGLTASRPYPDRCRATPLKALVAADGHLYVCCRRRESKFSLGDLHENDFWSIWRDPRHQAILAGIIPSKCGECPQVEYNDLIDRVFDSDEAQVNLL